MNKEKPFTILQYNIRKEKDGVMAPLLEDKEVKDIDILAIQEPCGHPINQTSYNLGSSGFHLVHLGGPGVRTCFYVNKKIDTDSWEPVYRGGDLCSLKMTLEPERRIGQGGSLETSPKAVWIHNVYNPSPVSHESNDSPSTLPLVEEALSQEGEHILLGDFNLHHTQWNNKGRYTYHRMADRLVEIVADHGMELGLPEDSVTWRSRGAESTIDLIFLSEGASQATISCQVEDNLHYGSDHWPIKTTFVWSGTQPTPKKRRAWKKMEDEKIGTEVKAGAKALNWVLGTPDLDSQEDIDQYLAKMLTGFDEIVELTIPWAAPGRDPKSFWNADCTRVTRSAKQKLKTYIYNGTQEAKEELRKAERTKVQTLRKARTLAFREGVHKASIQGGGIWRLARWGRERSMLPKALPQFPAIKDKQGRMAEDFEGKVRNLRETLLPPPREADLEDIEGTNYPPALAMEDQITEKEVLEAIWHPAADKAPGISGIPNRFLRKVAKPMLRAFVHLFKACIRIGYHPRRFKEANTVILKKPRKADYSEPKAYRPIALLDTLGKSLETLLSKRLYRMAEEYKMLPPQQMGARKNRSVETALETLTDAVHTVWNQGGDHVASLLSLDVAGAFDNVSHGRLLHNLKMKRVPQAIVAWTASFLGNRATTITLGNRTSELEEVYTGIPQGSPISPILFLFFNAPLIEECARANLPIQTGGFVDDVHLLAYSSSTETNCTILEKAHKICLRWAETHGASFAPQKYELVHMTRKPKKFNMTKALDFEGVQIHPETSIRVLGLHIDGKLRWGPHLAQLKDRALTQSRAIKCLAGSTWGATFQRCRTIYNMVVRPMLTFAAPIWHNPAGTKEATKSHSRKLALIQNDCLRTVLGAYKATPIPVLEAEARVRPIGIQLDRLVLKYQATKGTHPQTIAGNQKIQRQLKNKRGRRRIQNTTPSEEKGPWALKTLDCVGWDEAATDYRRKPDWHDPVRDIEPFQDIHNIHKKINQWAAQSWIDKWEGYKTSLQQGTHTPAQQGGLFDIRLDYHVGLRKAESSIAIGLRSGKVGLNHFLQKQKVPGFERGDCPCGWWKQDVRHILIFCPNLDQIRPQLFEQAETKDARKMLTTLKGIRAAARWMVRSGVLGQYSLAKEQLAISKLPTEIRRDPGPKKPRKKKKKMTGKPVRGQPFNGIPPYQDTAL